MIRRIKTILRMTAVKMSLIYMALFTVLSIILVYYITFSTAKVLHSEIIATINEEITSLSKIYRRGNMAGLIRAVDRRSKSPGANLYLLVGGNNQILAGNVAELPAKVLSGERWHKRPFQYSRFGDDGKRSDKKHIAVGKTFDLPGHIKLMIGRDVGQLGHFRTTIRRALILALGLMTLMGVLVWIFIGRRALKRLDGVSDASKRILSGDLSERLPLAGTGDEFDRLSENLNQMLTRVETLNEGLREVSDNIAHDLKTPITRLRNKAELTLAKDATKQEYEETIQDVVEEADRLIKTFNALLMISRVEAGSQAAQISDIDLSQILADVHELYEPVAEEENLILELHVPEKFPFKGNRELLAQAISNLIDNAMKYGRAEAGKTSKVSLMLESQNNHAVISVSDNGSGIDVGDYERVKKRFVRLEKSRTEAGTGLGLSLVNAVTSLHGGKLEFKDNNPGLIAQIELPL